MQNLRDKLLKAGLVTKEESREAEEREARARQAAAARPEAPRRRPPREAAPTRPLPPVPTLPLLPGSKAHHRQEATKQRELDEKLRDVVLLTEVPFEVGAHPFHFVTRKGKLRRLELSEAQAAALESGQLAVVERQEPAQIEHTLVPPEAAERMLELFPRAVRFYAKAGAAVGFLTEDELRRFQDGSTPESAETSDASEAARDAPQPGGATVTAERSEMVAAPTDAPAPAAREAAKPATEPDAALFIAVRRAPKP